MIPHNMLQSKLKRYEFDGCTVLPYFAIELQTPEEISGQLSYQYTNLSNQYISSTFSSKRVKETKEHQTCVSPTHRFMVSLKFAFLELKDPIFQNRKLSYVEFYLLVSCSAIFTFAISPVVTERRCRQTFLLFIIHIFHLKKLFVIYSLLLYSQFFFIFFNPNRC